MMRTVLHMPLDPSSRFVRLVLAEKGLPARLVETRPWEDSPDLDAHNPARTLPVLIDESPSGGEVAVSPAPVAAEYLEEAYPQSGFLPATSAGRAETRRLIHWFEAKFEAEVNARILRSRIDRRLQGVRHYEPAVEREGRDALAWHLDYVNWLLETRAWIAAERLTMADLCAAAHLSANDYIDAVPWSDFPQIKEWYARIKSRPSFKPLLNDRIEGLPPPSHYDDLDF